MGLRGRPSQVGGTGTSGQGYRGAWSLSSVSILWGSSENCTEKKRGALASLGCLPFVALVDNQYYHSRAPLSVAGQGSHADQQKHQEVGMGGAIRQPGTLRYIPEGTGDPRGPNPQ